MPNWMHNPACEYTGNDSPSQKQLFGVDALVCWKDTPKEELMRFIAVGDWTFDDDSVFYYCRDEAELLELSLSSNPADFRLLRIIAVHNRTS